MELALYKLFMTPDPEDTDLSYVSEFGWVSNTEFFVWVSYLYLEEFMEGLTEIFGDGIFDEGGFDANMQEDGICFDLEEAVGGYLDLEEVFPKDKFRH